MTVANPPSPMIKKLVSENVKICNKIDALDGSFVIAKRVSLHPKGHFSII